MAAAEPKPPYATGYPASSTSAPYPAYPYPPPPYYGAAPPTQQPYYFNDNNYYHSSPSTYASLLRRFFLAMIAVFVFIGVVTIVIWLVLRPQLPSFSVSSASISSFNLSSSPSLLSSNFDLTLSVHNPNKKMTIYYDSVDAAIYLGSRLASETSLTPFSQGKGNSTEIVARLSSMLRYIDAGTGDAVLGTRKSEGAVYLNFRVFSWVRFKDGAWRTRRHSLRVYCDDLKIAFANAGTTSGSLVGSPKDCLVNL